MGNEALYRGTTIADQVYQTRCFFHLVLVCRHPNLGQEKDPFADWRSAMPVIRVSMWFLAVNRVRNMAQDRGY